MPGMMDPRMRQMMGAPAGPVPQQQLTPGFRSPGLPGFAPMQQQQPSGMNPLALMGMMQMMQGGKDGGKSIGAMDPSSFGGVIEGMTGADAQRYLGSMPGQDGGFMNWLRGLRGLRGFF